MSVTVCYVNNEGIMIRNIKANKNDAISFINQTLKTIGKKSVLHNIVSDGTKTEYMWNVDGNIITFFVENML